MVSYVSSKRRPRRFREDTSKPRELSYLRASGAIVHNQLFDIVVKGRDLRNGFVTISSGLKLPTEGITTYWNRRTYINDASFRSWVSSHMEEIAQSYMDLYPSTPIFIAEENSFDQSSMEDVVIPNFKNQVKAGRIFNNPMTRHRVYANIQKEGTPSEGTDTFGSNVTGTSHGGSYVFDNIRATATVNINARPKIPTSRCPRFIFDFLDQEFEKLDINDSHDSAVADAFTSSREAEVNVPLFVAEIEDTIDLIGSAAKRIAAFLVNVKKLRFKKVLRDITGGSVGKAADNASSLWLEARYGWIPTMLDLKAAFDLLERKARPILQSFRGFQTDEKQAMIDEVLEFDGLGYRVTGIVREDFSARAVMLCETSVEGLVTSKDVGWGDWGQTALELVPFSFVLDWFIDVKPLFSRLVSNPQFKTVTSSVTRKTFSQAIVTVESIDNPQLRSTITYTIEHKERVIDPIVPFVTFNPSWNNIRTLDAAALIKQLT